MFEQKEINTRYGNMLIFTEDPTIGKALDLYGEYCHSEIELIKNYTDKTSFFIDVGANIGTHSIGVAPNVKRVLAFEPDLENFNLLTKNCALTMCKNVTCSRIAFSNEVGKTNTKFNFGKTTLCEGDDVIVTTIDNVSGLPRIDFIKIDVEGMEYNVLKGAERSINYFGPKLLIEMQQQSLYEQVYNFLKNMDYNIYWFNVATYTPDNHKQNKENVFGPGHGVLNWFASRDIVNMLDSVVDKDDSIERLSRRKNI